MVTDLTAKEMHRSFSDIDAMYLWQHPLALLRLAVKAQSEMTCEAFLSRGGSLEQKIQEALVGATFLSIFQRLVSPVMGRMARINEEALDIEARTANGAIYQLEITTAYPSGYRIREAYKNGSKPEIPQSAFAGEPISAEWVATTILRKTAKVEKKAAESSPLGLPEHIWWDARFKTAEETDLWCGIYLGLSMANFRSAGVGRRCPFVQYAWL